MGTPTMKIVTDASRMPSTALPVPCSMPTLAPIEKSARNAMDPSAVTPMALALQRRNVRGTYRKA
jgi:hypothetical protein